MSLYYCALNMTTPTTKAEELRQEKIKRAVKKKSELSSKLNPSFEKMKDVLKKLWDLGYKRSGWKWPSFSFC